MTRVLSWLLCIAGTVGCGSHAAPRPGHAALGNQVAARVGDADLPMSLVGEVARARGVTPGAALALLIDDAVASRAALAQGLDRTPEVQRGITTAEARATLDRIAADARATPPTDAEVVELTQVHWVDVDAPARMLVVHAVAMRPKKPDARLEAAAKAVAASIAVAVADAPDSDTFQARAKAVAHQDVEVTVEPLDPFAADGRVVVAGSPHTYDTQFVAGAEALPVGATSGVVETSFGWHVIKMLERLPPHVVPFEDRRRLFAEEVVSQRAQNAVHSVLETVSAREPPGFVNGVDDILAESLPVIRGEEATTAPRAP